MIEVSHLSKYYGQSAAVHDISFTVAPGEILGFLGPNGAGKTTTMRMLTGFLAPSAGTATVAGFDIQRQSLEVRRRVGYLPETVPLYTDLTTRVYLDFVAKLKGVPRSERKRRVDQVMEVARVTDVRDKIIGKLSKGYRQRVGLAQALVNNPEVLILDEPTVGLDPRQIVETRQLIKGLGGEHTIILSTHILPEVSMTCNRVVIINQGTIAAVDTPDALTRRLTGSERIHLEIRGPEAEIVKTLGALAEVQRLDVARRDATGVGIIIESQLGTDPRELLAATIIGRGWGLREMRTAGLSLEEIFVKVVTEEEPVETREEVMV
ncbi:MAG TPA: ABC transporter ATP-binding protein [Dehalococcoidia bacterium]|nr:ABC transporter ATP-binding protein [Dehalococcoidia bacterium]